MNNKVRFSGKIYYQAFSEGWLNSLSVYLYLCKQQSGKSFYYKKNHKTSFIKELATKVGISANSLNNHFKILINKEMITINEGEIKLVGNKTSRINKLYLNENTNSLKNIKQFLRSIPFISNLYSQKKAIEKKKYQQYLKNNPFATRSKSLRKKVYRGILSGESYEHNSELFLSVNKIGKLISRGSTRTICKYKILMKELKVINYKNSFDKLYSGISWSEYMRMIQYEIIPFKGTFFAKGIVYKNNPTTYNFVKNRGSNSIVL